MSLEKEIKEENNFKIEIEKKRRKIERIYAEKEESRNEYMEHCIKQKIEEKEREIEKKEEEERKNYQHYLEYTLVG